MELSPDTLRVAQTALHDYLYETERYLAGDSGKEPGPLDLCCDAHRGKFEWHAEMRRNLEDRRTTIQTAITEIGALIPKEDDGPAAEDTTSTTPAAPAADEEV